MNKLEVLYKMSKAMKVKENINGEVNVLVLDGENQLANINNKFKKDLVNNKMSIDAKAKINIGDINIDKSIQKDLDLEKMREMHKGMHKHHHHHGEGKKCNKFAKLEFLFKTLNDMDLSENGDLKVIELDIKPIIEKKKEKIKAHKEMMKNSGHECKMEECKCEDFKDMLKAKHAIFSELCKVDYDKVMLKLTIGEDFSIKSVNVLADGEKVFKFNAELSY